MQIPRASALLFTIGLFAWACTEVPTESRVATTEATADAKPPWAGGGGGGDGGGETSSATTVSFSDRADDNILSDDRGDYIDGDCGVLADFNVTDARLDPDANYKGKAKRECPEGPRGLNFVWDDPVDGGSVKPDRLDGIFMNIDAVETETGVDVLHAGQFNVCNRLVFDPNEFPGSDALLVSFDDGGTPSDESDDSWTVRTQAGGNDVGYCVGDGRYWHMPLELTIRRK